MANEVNVQATLTYSKYTPQILQVAAFKDVTQTGKSASSRTVNVTAAALLPLGNENASPNFLGYIFVKNLDAALSVKLSLASSSQYFANLLPGQFCLIPWNLNAVSSIWAEPSSGSPLVLIMAVEQ
ncbi:MAG: hypothetical protein HYR88_00425 [Verrucomicrobia bacterium]|nr:hypothetical protein [Verrucomicrobiota bacterium]MBI3871251.1 hypothetical protein [Verrucomicrobiota bacterium]